MTLGKIVLVTPTVSVFPQLLYTVKLLFQLIKSLQQLDKSAVSEFKGAATRTFHTSNW